MEDHEMQDRMIEAALSACAREKPLDMVQLAKDILGIEGECAPYPWCRGNPTVKDCIRLGYCAKDPNCGE